MAWQHSWPEPNTASASRERPTMTLLPKLEAEERDALIRQREDEARAARVTAAMEEMERTNREAYQAIEASLAKLKQELRFPLESVRVDDDDA